MSWQASDYCQLAVWRIRWDKRHVAGRNGYKWGDISCFTDIFYSQIWVKGTSSEHISGLWGAGRGGCLWARGCPTSPFRALRPSSWPQRRQKPSAGIWPAGDSTRWARRSESPSYLVEAILCGSHVFFRHKTILLLDVTTGPGFENTNGLIYTSYCTQIVMVSFSDAVAASHYNMPVGVPHCIFSSSKCRTLTAEEFTKAPQMKLGDITVCRRCSPAMCHPATGCSCRSKWAPLTASLALLTSSWTASMTAITMMAGSTRWEPCGS
jgi:hypothetical protein